MTKKRWLLVTMCLVTLIGLPILVIALLPPRPGVTEANIERVEIGMTRAEVEGILGPVSKHSLPPMALGDIGHSRALWTDSFGAAGVVVFDERDCVLYKAFGDGANEWQKLRRLIRLR